MYVFIYKQIIFKYNYNCFFIRIQILHIVVYYKNIFIGYVLYLHLCFQTLYLMAFFLNDETKNLKKYIAVLALYIGLWYLYCDYIVNETKTYSHYDNVQVFIYYFELYIFL